MASSSGGSVWVKTSLITTLVISPKLLAAGLSLGNWMIVSPPSGTRPSEVSRLLSNVERTLSMIVTLSLAYMKMSSPLVLLIEKATSFAEASALLLSEAKNWAKPSGAMKERAGTGRERLGFNRFEGLSTNTRPVSATTLVSGL